IARARVGEGTGPLEGEVMAVLANLAVEDHPQRLAELRQRAAEERFEAAQDDDALLDDPRLQHGRRDSVDVGARVGHGQEAEGRETFYGPGARQRAQGDTFHAQRTAGGYRVA